MALLTILSLSMMLVAMTSGCTKAKHATRQQQAQLPVPGYDTGGQPPFLLMDAAGERTYSSSNLLVWDPGVTAEQIQKISDDAVNGRVISAQTLKFAQAQQIPALEAAQKSAQARLDQLKTLESAEAAGKTGATAAAARTSLAGWFDARVATLAAADQAAATKLFPVYCEAKIWELAANPLLANAFTARPTPLEICEPYYAQAKLLDRQSPECQDAPAGGSRSYLDCLWKQGVVKTSIFAARAAQPAASQDFCKDNATTASARLAALVASGQLQAELGRALADPAPQTALGLWTSIYNNGNPPAVFSFAADCPKLFIHPDGGDSNNASQLGFDPVAAYANFNQQSLGTIILAVEFQIPANDNPSRFSYTLLPINADASGNPDPIATVVARYNLLANDIRAFAVRFDPNNQAAKATDLAVNDYLVNWPAGKSGFVAPQLPAVTASPAFAALAAALRGIQTTDYAKPISDAQAAVDLAVRRIATAQDAIKKEIHKPGGLDELTAASGKDAAARGIAQLIAGFSLTVGRHDDALEARLTFRGASRSTVGCVTGDGGACAPTPRQGETQKPEEFVVMKVDPEANELTLDLAIDDPVALGLVFKAVEDLSVDTIPAEALAGRTLHLEAFANKLDGQLDFYTGSAEVRDAAGAAVYKGSISGSAVDDDLKAYGFVE